MSLRVVPITLRQAQEFVQRLHRHNKPPVGCKFAIGVRCDDTVVGVATAGRPVARALDDGLTLEINRTCTDGTLNANSMLYGAAWRAAKAMGYLSCFTYIRSDESGASLRAAGWVLIKELPARGDWIDSSVKMRALREPTQQTFIEDERRRTGAVARQMWGIGLCAVGRANAGAKPAAAHAPDDRAVAHGALQGNPEKRDWDRGEHHAADYQLGREGT